MSDDDLLAELMTELRVRRADVSRDGFVQSLTFGELMVLKRKWERAAAERMRERMLTTIPVCMHFDAQDGGCTRIATHYDEDAGYEPMYCDAHARLLDEPTEFGWAELVRAAPTDELEPEEPTQ